MGQKEDKNNKSLPSVAKKSQVGGDLDVVESSIRFRGSCEHSLDIKGRLNLPNTYRQQLENFDIKEVVVTNFVCDGARCLEGFAKNDWLKFEEQLAERSRFDPKVKKLENFYIARAAFCSLDSSGRINIPSYLREYAGFEKKVIFTGSIHGFRMWDLRVWNLVFQEAESALIENPELFMDVDR